MAEACVDQCGSRFIQDKYEACSPEEKAMVLEEVAPQLAALTTNVYGNYVIQLLVKFGGPEAQELVF